jgi:amidophosphoribosyltransferase
MAASDELIASDKTVDEIRDSLGATSLAYLSLEGLQDSTERAGNRFCRACLTRTYPTEIPDDLREGGRFRFEARPAPVA